MNDFKTKCLNGLGERFNFEKIFGKNSESERELKQYLSTCLDNLLVEVEKEIDVRVASDHSKCPLPQTCMGYTSAVDDVHQALASFKGETK